VAAARAGKHLYLDKPLAGSLSDADAVRKAVEEAGVVAHMWSFVSGNHTRAARNALQARALGDPVALHFDACFAKGHAGSADLGKPRRESPAPDEYELPDSKRELTNVGVYPLVSLFWLLKCPVRRVSASTGNYFFREHQQNGMEDFGQMLLELDDGTLATVSAGRTGWQSHPTGGLNRVAIAGTTGLAVFDAARPRVEVWSDAPCWMPPERDPEDPMSMWGGPKDEAYKARPKQDWIAAADDASQADVKHFLDCIEEGRTSEVPVRTAAAATEVLLAAYQSAASGDIVSLPLPR
jgi:predicted dehydrogenase